MLEDEIMVEISVIMPVYNETIKELKNSINSILHQTYKNFEFIIVDDNPKSRPIKKYLIYKSYQDIRIKIFFNKRHLGSMNTANKAIKLSIGKFIARMDADDIAQHNRLQSQLIFCLRYNLDFSCSNYRLFNNNNVNKVTSYPDVDIVNQNKIKHIMAYINIAIGPTLFFKRDILKITGVYRNILCEDYDLAARSLIYNCKMGYLSESLIYKRDRKNNISRGSALKEFIICNIISKYLRKYNFSKIVNLKYIYNKVNKLKIKDIVKYNKFINYSLQYRENNNLSNLVLKYIYAFSSILMIKWVIFMHFSNRLQNYLLK